MSKIPLFFIFKPRTILYFLLKWNSGSKPQNRYEAVRRYSAAISHRNAMACCIALRHRTAPRGWYSAAIGRYWLLCTHLHIWSISSVSGCWVSIVSAQTRHQHIWVHWIMSFSQIIIDVDMSMSCPCLSLCFIAAHKSLPIDMYLFPNNGNCWLDKTLELVWYVTK